MKRIRVCQLIWDLSACGTQQVAKYLATRIDPTCFESVVWTFHWGPIADEIAQEGVAVRHFEKRIPKLDPGLITRLRRSLKSEDIQILHTHLFGATLHGTLAATGIPNLSKIVTLHNRRDDNLLQSLFHPLLFSKIDRIITVSKDATSSTLARHRTLNKKLITIPNGIDTKPFSRRCSKALIREKLKLPAQKQIIGTIGRLTTQKGYCDLLQSFAQVKRTVAEAYLLVIGEGELLDSLQQLTRELQLDGSVRFWA